MIHKADLDKFSDADLAKIIGMLSWKLNPENELHLYGLLREQPLFEVLQEGHTTEERNLNIERNSRHLFLDGAGKKKNAAKAARQGSSTPI